MYVYIYILCHMVICDICVSESEVKSTGAIQRPVSCGTCSLNVVDAPIYGDAGSLPNPFVHRLEQGLIPSGYD